MEKSGVKQAIKLCRQVQDNLNARRYVQKDGNKVLSTNDYTDAEKTKLANLSADGYTTAEKDKLAGIESGAQVNIIDGVSISGDAELPITDKKAILDLSGYVQTETGKGLSTEDFTTAELSGYVQTETGKGLSTEDFTTAEKTKLQNISDNANNYTLPQATSSDLGGVKLSSTGSSTDGAMTRKAVSDALDLKANLSSPALTGTPTAPTAGNDTDSTQLATTEFVQNLIRRLVGSTPDTLDTLVELATAINQDPNFATTVNQALDNKLNKTANAASATKLQTARALQVSLSSASAPTFNGAADCKNIGVTGALPIANGGTGATTVANARKGLFGSDLSTSGKYLLGITYGVCSTAAATAAKTVAVTSFVLRTGAKVAVKFTYGNNAANPTLNVNGTGAKPIYYKGYLIAEYYIASNTILELIYDGTNWNVVNEVGFRPMFSWDMAEHQKYLPIGKPIITPTNAKFAQALYLDGCSGVAYKDAIVLGGKDFTIDFWANIFATQTNQSDLISLVNSTGLRFGFRHLNGKCRWNVNVNSENHTVTESMPNTGTTNHFAVVFLYASKKLTYYVNGRQVYTTSFSSFPENKGYMLQLGTYRWYNQSSTNDAGSVGTIEELRISDCARWTANFTVPSAAYTADDNTLLLMHFD